MKVAAPVLALAGSAAAFAPVAQQQSSATALSMANLQDLPGSTLPIKNFDPLKLADLGSDETLRWFQASELKHSRCAMVATTGFLIQAAGFHFPGQLSSDVSFESLSGMNPIQQWEQVPYEGKAQILLTILIAEIASEAQGTHYMKGGEMPVIVFPPIKMAGILSDEAFKKRRSSELNNGRLAMIAILSFISEYNIPGSVPALSGLPAFHS